jgi:hypothetical protein
LKTDRPRLSIDLTPVQQEFLRGFPFGWKQQIFSILIDMLMEMTKRCGMRSLSVIMARAIKLEDYFEDQEEEVESEMD